jgi:hypothetical protein
MRATIHAPFSGWDTIQAPFTLTHRGIHTRTLSSKRNDQTPTDKTRHHQNTLPIRYPHTQKIPRITQYLLPNYHIVPFERLSRYLFGLFPLVHPVCQTYDLHDHVQNHEPTRSNQEHFDGKLFDGL